MAKSSLNTHAKKGFTLIELLVVLAIIGILIALAIIGLRAAQATQRDTARKDLAGQINGIIQQYVGNNNGGLITGTNFYSPTVTTTFIYLNSGTCPNGLVVYNSCVGLDGLAAPTGAAGQTASSQWYGGTTACPAGTMIPSSANSDQSTFVFCYSTGAGSAGYQFFTYLEANTSYAVAQ